MKKITLTKVSIMLYLGFFLTSLLFPVYSTIAVTVCTAPQVLHADGSCVDPQKSPYVLLTPLPAVNGDKGITSFNPEQADALGAYLNLMLKIFIGLCAVFAVIMIVIGGIEYMTTELISSKAAGMDRVKGAIFGLLLALGAYAILFTINPNLLTTDITVNGVRVEAPLLDLIDFTLSTAQTGGGPSIKISVKEACEDAKVAEAATGVDRALILSIFGQESGGGVNTGKCTINNTNVFSGTRENLQQILNSLPKDSFPGNTSIDNINVSCAGGGSSSGGALGYTQVLPSTWNASLKYAKTKGIAIDHTLNPWVAKDALLMGSIYLKQLKEKFPNPRDTACHYFSGPQGGCTQQVPCGAKGQTDTYGNCVMRKMDSARKQCP